MRQSRALEIQQLDKQLAAFKPASEITRPPKGWIRALRSSLKITLEQLGTRLGISRQGMQSIEQREANGALTLKACQEVGEALNMQFVYGFVPRKGSLQKTLEGRAYFLAEKIVMRTHQHMVMEAQGNDEKRLKKSIEELAQELIREMPRALWD